MALAGTLPNPVPPTAVPPCPTPRPECPGPAPTLALAVADQGSGSGPAIAQKEPTAASMYDDLGDLVESGAVEAHCSGLGLDITPSTPISKAFADYRERKRGDWDDKARVQIADAKHLMVGLMGDQPISRMNRKFAAALVERAVKMLRLRGKSAYAGLSPGEALKARLGLAALLKASGGVPNPAEVQAMLPAYDPVKHAIPLSALAEIVGGKTVNKYLTYWSGFHTWLLPHLGEEERASAFKGQFRSKKQVRAEARDRPRHWARDELARLFTSPLYAGWSRYRHIQGRQVVKDWHHWCPLLCYLAMLRREEASQLKCADVITDQDGVIGIKVRPDLEEDMPPAERSRKSGDRKVKTLAAIRDIPVHPFLVKAGFLDYVAEARQNVQEWLFPELATGSDLSDSLRRNSVDREAGCKADKGARLGTWFGRYCGRVGLGDPTLDLHGLRTSGHTRLVNNGVTAEYAEYMMGHASGRVGMQQYFGGFDGRNLREMISRIEVPPGLKALAS